MPVHVVPRPASPRRVLVTGASGVVGTALLHALRRHRDLAPVCLARRRRPPGAVHVVDGDVTRAGLGLAASDRRWLVRGVDAVVHCAGSVRFDADDEHLTLVNVHGTAHVARFAAEAAVPLYHVSTAFVGADAGADAATGYARSKRHGEQVVRETGGQHVVVRPSIVVGDSGTGEISDHQGLYQGLGRLLQGRLPVLPLAPGTRLDMVPRDLVAEAVVALVRARVVRGDYWVTAGPGALTLDRAVRIVLRVGRRLGLPVRAPRYLWGADLDRWLAHADAPARERTGATWFVRHFGAYLAHGDRLPGAHLPTSAEALARLGVRTGFDPGEVFARSVRHWARTHLAPGVQRVGA